MDEPPELATSERDPALVDRAAAGAAFELVRRTELLLDRWGTHPPPALKAGGLGVRDLRAAAALLHVEIGVAALVIETAAAAGLLDQGMADDLDAAWLPTDAFDAWQLASTAQRWATLARAWLASPRLVSAVGGRDRRQAGQRPLPRPAPQLAGRGSAPTCSPSSRRSPADGARRGHRRRRPSSQRLRWRRPRRPPARLDQVAPLLGGGGAARGHRARRRCPRFGRLLVAGEDPADALERAAARRRSTTSCSRPT